MYMNWNDISLRQYLDITDVYEDTTLDDADKLVKLCWIVYDIDILQVPITEYHKYVEGLNFIGKKIPKSPLVDEYTVNGHTYVMTDDVSKMNVAQYMDIDLIIKKDTSISNYPELLSAFMIPKGHKYGEGYQREKIIGDMEDLPITHVVAIAAFFLRCWKRYIRLSLIFLYLRMRKLPKAERKKIRQEMKTMEKITLSLCSRL